MQRPEQARSGFTRGMDATPATPPVARQICKLAGAPGGWLRASQRALMSGR